MELNLWIFLDTLAIPFSHCVYQSPLLHEFSFTLSQIIFSWLLMMITFFSDPGYRSCCKGPYGEPVLWQVHPHDHACLSSGVQVSDVEFCIWYQSWTQGPVVIRPPDHCSLGGEPRGQFLIGLQSLCAHVQQPLVKGQLYRKYDWSYFLDLALGDNTADTYICRVERDGVNARPIEVQAWVWK